MIDYPSPEYLDDVRRCAVFVRAWLACYARMEPPKFNWGPSHAAGFFGTLTEETIQLFSDNTSATLLLLDLLRYRSGVTIFMARVAIDLAEDATLQLKFMQN